MALKKCSDCENMISSDAGACPHCGKRESSLGLIYGFILASVGFMLGIIVLAMGYKQLGVILIPSSIVWFLVLVVMWKIKFR